MPFLEFFFLCFRFQVSTATTPSSEKEDIRLPTATPVTIEHNYAKSRVAFRGGLHGNICCMLDFAINKGFGFIFLNVNTKLIVY